MGTPDSSGSAARAHSLDVTTLATMLREKRGTLSLRKAADEAGVSFTTFSRVEGGAQPDLVSFTNLCAWLEVPPSRFFAEGATRRTSPVEEVARTLSADPRLTMDAAAKITDLVRTMYDALAAPPVEHEQPALELHLRAAKALRPGVAVRLSSVLRNLDAELRSRIAKGNL